MKCPFILRKQVLHVAEYTANINGEVLLPQDRLVDWFVKNPWTDAVTKLVNGEVMADA